MKRVFTKLACTAMAAVMTITCAPVANFTTATAFAVEAEAATTITAKTGSWFETAYVEWLPVTNAATYEAYVRKSGASSYTKLDDELIRQYDTYCRADALGLSAGNYQMKIVAKDSSGTEIATTETGTIAVAAYKRDGFAFSSGSYEKGAGLGGYKADGTPKDDAVILYITDENKNTIQYDVVTSSKGTTKTCTGLGEIVGAFEKGYETRPFIFRFVGEIAPPYSSSKFTLDVTDDEFHAGSNNSYRILDVKYNMKNISSGGGITFEGVGNDTVLHFNFNLVGAKDIEVRNFAFKDMTTKDEDAVTITSQSTNYWVHNNDFFYGGQGSDKDQAKGDGCVDIKGTPDMGTISDNHFWDTGKSSLCGLNEKADYHVTYARNWFDHSDSRHPRIRTGSVHIYNNYYDGNAKYGVGVTEGASAFVEANYFRSANDVMMSSNQGTDAQGTGTFSHENGGIIKAYNNIMAGTYKFIDGTNSDGSYNQDSDAYTVASRSEKLSSDLVTVSGGTSYNNFDTTMDLGVKESDILAPAEVPAYVMANAGRCDGGNFTYAFNDSKDDDDYSVNSDLVTALGNYRSSIITIGGTVKTQPNTSATASSATGVDGNTSYQTRDAGYVKEAAALPTSTETSGNTSTGGSTGGTVESDLTVLAAGKYTAATIVSDTEHFTVSNNKATTTGQLKIGTGYVLFKVNDNATVTVNFKCGSTASGTSASVKLNGQESASVAGKSGATAQDFTVSGLEAGSYKLTANAGSVTAQIVSITVSYSGSTNVTESTSEATTAATTVTTVTTETSTETPTETPTEGTTSEPVESDSAKISFNNGYSFKGVKGTLTTDSSYGGAYYTTSGTPANNGENKVTLDGTNAIVTDTDGDSNAKTGLTTNLILPITSASKGTVTISGTMTPSVAATKWTLLQIWGKNAAGENQEIVGIRTTDSEKNYGSRVNAGDTNDMGIASTKDVAVGYSITIDVTNKTAKVTLDKTTKEYTGVDVASVDTIKFVTAATASRNITVSDVTVSYATPTVDKGDADCNGTVDELDVALILKYLAGAATLSEQGYINAAAMADGTSTVDILDAIAILNSLGSDDGDDTPSIPVVTGEYNHNFTTDGKTSDFFTISGNLSTGKGSVEYNGLTLTQCLKMESSTSIKFTGAGTIILVFGGTTSADEKDVKIDGTTYTTNSNGVLIAEVGSGEHTISKDDVLNLFYMSFAPDED